MEPIRLMKEWILTRGAAQHEIPTKQIIVAHDKKIEVVDTADGAYYGVVLGVGPEVKEEDIRVGDVVAVSQMTAGLPVLIRGELRQVRHAYDVMFRAAREDEQN